MPKLGVNIDHVATIRQARKTVEPDPVAAAVLCELAGCDSITVHLREDRRHIQDRDVRILRQTLQVPMNLEMACTDEMVALALELKPAYVCLVPEKRVEVTTEGGLDLEGAREAIAKAIATLGAANIAVSLFIDPDVAAIRLSRELKAPVIELHTGQYAHTWRERAVELGRLQKAVELGRELGLVVNAGHGLTYQNVGPVARLAGLHELNIGHSIVSRAVLVGIDRAVREMIQAMHVAGPHS
jgi:pyridoxine 5-phosphate synthase